jgi:tetratricopeptide (TPR) repeat protein
LLILFFFNCGSFIKPSIELEEDKFEKFKNDTEFILLDENLKPIPLNTKLKLEKEIKKLINSKNLHDQNNIAIYGLKISYIYESEKILQDLTRKNPTQLEVFLNLIRIYHLLEEYNELRKEFQIFYSNNKDKLSELLNYLQKKNRIEEKIAILDYLATIPEFENKSLEEIGTYFLGIRDYNQAKFYFEKLLANFAYNKIALLGMMEVHSNKEDWKQVIEKGKLLQREKKTKKFTSLLARAYFESADYSNTIRVIEETPDTEKLDIEILTLWRDSIYSKDLNSSADRIRRHLSLLKKSIPSINEDDFFSRESDIGKKTSQFIINGF